MTGRMSWGRRRTVSLRGVRPEQHRRKRGHVSLFGKLIERICRGTTTQADAWHVLSLHSRMIRAEAERDVLRATIRQMEEGMERETLRDWR